MKKTLLLFASAVLVLGSFRASSQTTSMDFTRTDCQGVEHHLYQELDEGKVVVLEYIMLGCSSCILATDQIKLLIEPFEASQPGRVRQYIFGFIKNYNCSQLGTWQIENNLRGVLFEDGSSQVGYYGGMGMPTIVVTATNTHQVLYKKVGFEPSDTTAIKAAISTGLAYNPQGIGDPLASKGITVWPTLFTDHLSVKFPSPSTGHLRIYDILGKEVASRRFEQTTLVTVTGLDLRPGIYFIVPETQEGVAGSMKIIRQ